MWIIFCSALLQSSESAYFLFDPLLSLSTHKNSSSNQLDGNRSNPVLNAAGKDDKNHTRIYHSFEIMAHPDIRLTRGGMILIGLMSGGDYHQRGLDGCGVKIAHGLAKCGLGDTLFEAAQTMTREELETFLISWRRELRHELCTDSKGHIGHRNPSLANSVPSDFPNVDILLSYTHPITSRSTGNPVDTLKMTLSSEPDLGKLAAVCESYFEWGFKERIIKRFRNIMWHSVTLRILRRAVLHLDHISLSTLKSGEPEARKTSCRFLSSSMGSEGSGNEDEQLIIKIHSERSHVSTDKILEYRVEIAPAQLVRLAESGIKGLRSPEDPDKWKEDEDEDEDGKSAESKKSSLSPESHIRLWIPACMVRLVEPRLVQEYQVLLETKSVKKARKGQGKKTAIVSMDIRKFFTTPATAKMSASPSGISAATPSHSSPSSSRQILKK